MKPACKILIFRLFSCRFNDVVNLDNIITLSDDFKFGYFVGLAVKFAYDAGVVSTGAFVSAARRRYGQIHSFIFIKSVPNAKETPKERICVVPTHRKPKPNKSGHSLVPPSAHILPYVFSVPCKRQALIFSLPSHPHQARFYRCALICFIVSFIWLCLTPFTAAPLICGLAFTCRVSAVSFAWLCGGDW